MEGYLDEAPCLYFATTDDGAIVEVNKMLCTCLGYNKQELIGQKLELIFPIATRIFYQTHFFPLLSLQGHTNEIFISLQSKSKEHIPVLINANRNMSAGSAINQYAGIVVQHRQKFEEELIAARKAAEAALNENTALLQAKKELQTNLEQSDAQIILIHKQNEELKQFNRVVTHDLQEPLRKLSVFIQQLRDATEPETQQKIIEKLVKVTTQMGVVVSGLQQYVWLTETKPTLANVALGTLVEEVKQELKQEYSGIDLIVEAKQLPPIHADPGQMRVLLYQLMSNAVRFRREKSLGWMQVTAVKLQHNRFRQIPGKYKFDDFIKIEIRDNGTGFDSAYEDQVFELFKRLHPESGRGIGLSLCKKIIENHAGRITISSGKGKGTTVTILLPVEKPGAI